MIPFFLKKRETGVLPITDARMTRFWITLEQGVNFVLQSMDRMMGGELFVPKIPSMNIMDLAKAIASECRTEIVGIRSGEKLHEVMVPRDDARNTVEFSDHYVIKPQFRYFDRRFKDNGCQQVPDDFEYNSGTNPWRLSVEEMREMIKALSA